MTIRIAHELKDLPRYPLGDLLELQGDLKDLTERNAGKLRRSITKHGLFVPFFVWPAPDGNTYILDGHQRAKLMKADGHGALPVPCVLVHADTLQEAKEKLLVISSQYGRISQEGYDEFTFDLPDIGDIVHFDALSFEFGQDEDEEPEQGDAEAQVDRAAELQEIWQTERGQLWAIGEHRLLCGDSTVWADVERVMGGEEHNLMTDPPYGIDAAKMTMGSHQSSIPKESRLSNVENWDTEPIDIAPFVNRAKYSCVWGGQYLALNLPVSDDWLCWDKKNPNLSFAEFELAWTNYGTRGRILPHHWSGEEKVHITQKPLPVIMWAVSLCPDKDLPIFDPFGGSGTTMVACQNLGRKCRMVEISPSYVAVVLQRMADAFPGIDIYKVE